MKNTKYRAWIGSIIKINKRQGIAPKNGPKNGIIFVTPTMTLTSSAWGVPIKVVPIKQRQPIIAESIILPEIKPINVLLIKRPASIILFAFFL